MPATKPIRLVRLAVAASVVVSCQGAWGTGWYNLPSNFCQMMGMGFGGGYHAPMILGPPDGPCGACRVNEQRTFHPPRPQYYYGQVYSAPPATMGGYSSPYYGTQGTPSPPAGYYPGGMDYGHSTGYAGGVSVPSPTPLLPTPSQTDDSDEEAGDAAKQQDEPSAEKLPMPTI